MIAIAWLPIIAGASALYNAYQGSKNQGAANDLNKQAIDLAMADYNDRAPMRDAFKSGVMSPIASAPDLSYAFDGMGSNPFWSPAPRGHVPSQLNLGGYSPPAPRPPNEKPPGLDPGGDSGDERPPFEDPDAEDPIRPREDGPEGPGTQPPNLPTTKPLPGEDIMTGLPGDSGEKLGGEGETVLPGKPGGGTLPPPPLPPPPPTGLNGSGFLSGGSASGTGGVYSQPTLPPPTLPPTLQPTATAAPPPVGTAMPPLPPPPPPPLPSQPKPTYRPYGGLL